jgi:hypothetical protein
MYSCIVIDCRKYKHHPANRKTGEKKRFMKMYLKAEFCKYLAGLDSLKSGFSPSTVKTLI